MYDLLLVSVMHGVADGAKELQSLHDVQLVIVAVTVKRFTFDELHHKVGKTIFGSSTVEQACDVRVIERREDLSFLAKTTEDEIGVHPALDQFYCRSFVELIICAGCFIDRAHAAASDLSLDSIRSQPAANHRI